VAKDRQKVYQALSLLDIPTTVKNDRHMIQTLDTETQSHRTQLLCIDRRHNYKFHVESLKKSDLIDVGGVNIPSLTARSHSTLHM